MCKEQEKINIGALKVDLELMGRQVHRKYAWYRGIMRNIYPDHR